MVYNIAGMKGKRCHELSEMKPDEDGISNQQNSGMHAYYASQSGGVQQGGSDEDGPL